MDDQMTSPSSEPLRPFLIKAVTGGAGVQAAGMLLAFLVGVQLARGLGAEAYGQYGIAMAIVAIAGIVAEFGVPRLVTREVAAAAGSDDRRAVFAVLGWSNRTVAFTAAGIAILVALLGFALGGSSPALAGAILWGAILIPFAAFAKLHGAALQGLRHVVLGQVPSVLVRPLLFCLALLVLFWSAPDTGPAEAMALNVLAAFAAFLLAAFLLRRRLPSPEMPQARSEGKRWLSSAFVLGVTGGMWILQGQLTILVLALFASDAEVALFRVGLSTADMLAVPMTLIATVTAPLLAALHSTGSRGELQKLVTISARMQFAGVLVLALPLIIAAGPILGLVFGSEYEGGANALRILAAALLASAAFGVNATLLNMARHELRVARALGFGVATNLLLAFILVPRLGSVGAAWAYCGSLLVWNAIAWADARRLLGVSTILR